MPNKRKSNKPKTLEQFKAELKAELSGLANQVANLEKRVKALEESGSGELRDLSQNKQKLWVPRRGWRGEIDQ